MRTFYFVFILIGLPFAGLQGRATKTLPVPQILKEVLYQLYKASGNKGVPMPEIMFANPKTTSKGAYYNPKRNVIVFERKLYKICQSFKNDSLNVIAWLLGHELTHAFQKTGKDDILSLLDPFRSSNYRQEKEADLNGLFIAYLAGYDSHTCGIIPKFLERFYDAYGILDQESSNYPPLEERKKTTKEVLEKVKNLVHIFETAAFLNSIEMPQLAAECYRIILEHYKGTEIINNLGISYALAALQYSSRPKIKFPFELRWDSPLRRGEHPEDMRDFYLRRALSQFNSISQESHLANIHRLCVLIIQKKWQQAVAQCKKKLENNNLQKSYRERYKLVLALALRESKSEKNKKEGTRILEQLENSTSSNLRQFASINLHPKKIKEYRNCPEFQLPMGLVDNITINRLHHKDFKEISRGDSEITIKMKKLNNSIVYHFEKDECDLLSIQRIGTSDKQIYAPEGINGAIKLLKDGQIINCKDRNIAFRMKNGVMVEWLKYFEH